MHQHVFTKADFKDSAIVAFQRRPGTAVQLSFRKFIYSNQRKMSSGKAKGDTLEELARYFLKYRGIVDDINEKG